MEKLTYPRLDETLYRTTLPNGLDVLVLPRKDFSRKTAYFATDFGAVHTEFTYGGETYRMPAGVAHYLEHKLFDMPGDRDVTAEFSALGASPNAFTSYDMTAYYFSCTKNFEECLRLLLEFVSTPYFTEESVEKERGIIDQEIGMNEDTMENKVYENLVSAAYTHHPIRVPILGTSESIREITPEVLHTCHRAFYTPGNMMLAVVGDVDAEQVAAIAREILGDEQKETAVKLCDWQEELSCPQGYVERTEDVPMPMFTMLFKCAPTPMGEAGMRRELVADLAAEALFGESSELYLRLYEEGIIDYSFGGGFESVDGCAMLNISGDSQEPERVRDAIIAQGRILAREGISEEDFQRMKRSTMGQRIRGLDHFDSTCFRLCAYHMTDCDYFAFPGMYESITREEIREFLAEVIHEENCCLSVLVPEKKEETE